MEPATFCVPASSPFPPFRPLEVDAEDEEPDTTPFFTARLTRGSGFGLAALAFFGACFPAFAAVAFGFWVGVRPFVAFRVTFFLTCAIAVLLFCVVLHFFIVLLFFVVFFFAVFGVVGFVGFREDEGEGFLGFTAEVFAWGIAFCREWGGCLCGSQR